MYIRYLFKFNGTFLLLFSFFTLFPVNAERGRNIRFTHLTNEDGLPNNTAYSVCQDYKGFIWIATKSGLCKYDGKTIFIYRLAGEEVGVRTTSNQVRQVFEDYRQRLWAVSYTGVYLYNRDMDKFESIIRYSEASFIRVACDDNENHVYAAGNEILKYNETTGRFEAIPISHGERIQRNITCLISDKYGQLWAGTMFGGLLCVDIKNGKLSNYTHNENNPHSLISDKILSLYRDSENRIWIGTEDRGICYYDENSKYFVRIKDFPNVCVRAFAEDPDGNIWMGTEDGLYIYTPETGKFTNHKQNYNDKHSLNDNAIYAIFRDREDNMLLGTYFGGINIYPDSFRRFFYYDYGYSNEYLSGKAVRQIVGDSSGNLWIATEDGGLNYFDRQKDRFEHFKPGQKRNSISYHNVHSLLLDSRNHLWVGTYLGGLNRYDLKTKHFTHYSHVKYPDMIVDNVFSLIEDRDHEIWVGTTGGLSIFNPATNQFRKFNSPNFGVQSVDNLREDSDGNIWIATRMQGLYCYNKTMENLQNFPYISNGKGLSDNYVNYIFEDSRKNIWLATHEGGLCKYDRQTESFTVYTEKDGLPSNTVFGITESNSGNLWISTNNGLSCMDVINETFVNYSESEGLPNKQFNYNSVYRDVGGMLYFGTINGMIAFYPEDLQTIQNKARVEFTDLKVLGKSVNPEEKASPLSKNIGDVREIHLNSEQAQSFTFEFTVPTLCHPNSTFFAIKLDTDKDWSYIGSRRHVTYANLPHGEYIMTVKAAFNNRWDDMEPVSSIRIIIDPPFYLSVMSYIIYVLIILGIAVAFYLFMRHRQQEKGLILSERLEKEKIREINALKLNFFTNISHELRTPLSLILVPLQAFLDKNVFSPEICPKMKLIVNNARRMNNLVDELMLFTKIETKQEKIRVKKGDLPDFIRNISEGFHVLAEEKGLEYIIQIAPSAEEVWFAPVKVEIIVYNLLSNAFKYTDRGKITVTACLEYRPDYTYLNLSVSDTGVGIAPDETEKIFENYYQVNDFVKSKKTGFGIGLALVRELILLHRGSIRVDSEPGKGSVFTVKLNVSSRAFSPDEISDKDADARFMEDYKFLSVKMESKESEASEDAVDREISDRQYKMLVVEDNRELLNFYRELFSDIYTVITAENGREGCRIARRKLPDIIVSDVMMPEMNGIEMAHRLKSRLETCHIPLILLTAKTGEEAQLEGYNSGADLYVEKPFHPSLMRKQISNLLTTKENQKKLYLVNKIELNDIVTSERDKKLLAGIESIIMKNLDNDAFSVNDIMREMGVGRTLLHIKLKSMIGLSATEFINNVRIKESVKILLSGNNVSETAYATGFSSPNYYSRCFKKFFGMSPNEYLAKEKGKD
jgi:ligand-binding sensor domain-containing protein/signal transduction histidine kinase/DNA-binding response OmpR family regulator